jgi:tRNA-2-methylthio-N6-dimethylallyladenosine synthase
MIALDHHPSGRHFLQIPGPSPVPDRILRAMRRGHTTADYFKRIDSVKKARRRMSITSDIIVGFPGETATDFQDTLKLIEEVGYHGLYIFKYSERPGTPAAKLPDDVSREEKSARFIELESKQRRLQESVYGSYLGQTLDVLVERMSSRSDRDLTGHSTCQKVVNFPGDQSLLGEVVKVRISAAHKNSLYGEAASSTGVSPVNHAQDARATFST